MKWHIICLVTICLATVSSVEHTGSLTVDLDSFCELSTITAPASCCHNSHLRWVAIVLAYGATRPGRVTLYRRRSIKQPTTSGCTQSLFRKQRSTGKRWAKPRARPVTPLSNGDSAAEEDEHIPLRLVLRPGVILTGRGIQLRPMIARLGQDVEAYRDLWNDKDRFTAAIEHLLHRSCPLCGGKSGFRRVGSDRRSVIPPGSNEREWFRIQKVECRDCESGTRILPTFCIPFKSHHAQTIQNALENCWRRNNSYRDTTGIINQCRPADGQYVGHTLPYEWTIWLGGVVIHLPQFLVWLGLQLPRHGLLDEVFLKQDKGTDDHRIFGVAVQDPESTVIWNLVRADSNNTDAFKKTLQQIKNVGIHLRAITSDGWPAILRAVREELSNTVHLLCYFHAKKNVFETLEEYRKAKKLPEDDPELAEWRQAFFDILDAPNYKLYRARLRKLTKRVSDEPILLARCKSLQKKSHYNTWRLRSPLLAATTSRVELSFKFITRKMNSLYSFRRSKCNASQKSLTVWALVRDFVPYLPGAQYAGQSPAELAGVDLEGLPWLQYINLKLSEVD